jgi:glycosyltransferase involved in cell wall biosynthesis
MFCSVASHQAQVPENEVYRPVPDSRHVLLVSPCATHPPNMGNRRRILHLAMALRALGWQPTLLYTDLLDGDIRAMREWWGDDFYYAPYRPHDVSWRLKRIVRRMAPEDSPQRNLLEALRRRLVPPPQFAAGLRDLYDPSIEETLDRILVGHRFDAVIAEYVVQAPVLRRFKAPVRRIIDTHEVYSLDGGSSQSSAGQHWLSVTAPEEREALAEADVVLAIQDHDAASLRSAGVRRVETVGHSVAIDVAPTGAALRSTEVLFVASDHPFNVEGLNWFATEAYPRVASALPPRNVVIVGGVCSVASGHLPFRFEGRVQDLTPYYHGARAVIVPTISGTGLKIKLIEALGHGKAVVATAHAARGVEAGAGTAYLCGEDGRGFASALQQVMDDDSVCRALMGGAKEFAVRWNSEQHRSLLRALDT